MLVHKTTLFLCLAVFNLNIYSIGVVAQSEITVLYSCKEAYGNASFEQTLYFRDGIAHLQNHIPYTVTTAPPDIEYYYYHDHYDWFLDTKTKEVEEYRSLENSIRLKANWKDDFTWKLQDEYDEIAGHRVQKALGKAHYYKQDTTWNLGDPVAWFAGDIPISAGPDRYHGLPGLILKLEFTRNDDWHRQRRCVAQRIDFTASPSDITLTETEPFIQIDKEATFRENLLDLKALKKEWKRLRKGG